MVELIATAIITASSVLLFGYWLRCAALLLRGQYLPSEALSAAAREEVLLNPTPPIRSNAGIS
jgi:hypothetical protein